MSFVDFLTLINPRFLQEREVGLDIYLSGLWGWLPASLAVASATVFLLALFHLIPSRRHSVPLLLGLGVGALLVGLLGSYLNFTGFSATPDEPFAEILIAGQGAPPETESQKATLLCLPLLLGGGVTLESIGAALFLLVFGSRAPPPGSSATGRAGAKTSAKRQDH